MNEKFLNYVKTKKSISKEYNRFIDYLLSTKPKFVFGGGNQARITIELLKNFGVKPDGIIISSQGKVTKFIESDLPVYHLDEMKRRKTEIIIIMSIGKKALAETVKELEAFGFMNLVVVDDWSALNREIRISFCDWYFKDKGAVWKSNGENLEIMHIDGFRIVYYRNMPYSYEDMLAGNFQDLIIPSIYGDYSMMTEGAYEYKKVTLEKGDIVIDCGANVGMFSCVAAYKSKKVYAFEPTDETIEMLKKNQALYDNFEICPYALSDHNGEADFYVEEGGGDTGTNSLLAGRNANAKKVKVQLTTIDDFVKQNGIEHVDFIKADIEGAERYMLMGAKETLRKFAPKLSLCTYHLPDDPQVMERLILEANPNYKIEHKWLKLYAYVPDKLSCS